jgi:hypothetical protein
MNIVKKNAQGYGYKYTDLAEIHNYLESINAKYIQKVQRVEGDDYIFTKRCFNNELENEWLQGSRVVQATLQGIKNPAQEQGSALTYARRYSLLMAFGLATDDDDGASLTINTITNTQIQALNKAISNNNIDTHIVESILMEYGYNKVEDIKTADYIKIVNELKKVATQNSNATIE